MPIEYAQYLRRQFTGAFSGFADKYSVRLFRNTGYIGDFIPEKISVVAFFNCLDEPINLGIPHEAYRAAAEAGSGQSRAQGACISRYSDKRVQFRDADLIIVRAAFVRFVHKPAEFIHCSASKRQRGLPDAAAFGDRVPAPAAESQHLQ